MNWEAIGAVGEIVSALAVIGTIAYLAIQIRESSSIARSQHQRELLNIYSAFMPLAENKELAKIVRAGLTNFNKLTPTEKVQFHGWLHPFAAQIEAAYRMAKQGLMDKKSYYGFRAGLLSIVYSGGGAQWWELNNSLFIDFGDEINVCLKSQQLEIIPWTTLLPYFMDDDKDA